MKDSTNNGSASPATLKPSQRAESDKLRHPSFKHTFTSVFSSVAKEEDEHELYDQQSLPRRDYALLDEESAVPRRDNTTRELGQMPPAKLATMRDDFETGCGRS